MGQLQVKTKYPIYIVSKGRSKNHQTPKIFLESNIDFLIAVEPQEYDDYCKTIPEKYVLKLPFSNLGLGSFPARNHCWQHSIERGYDKHHLFDDNIRCFSRLNKGKRTKTDPLLALKTLETFTDRYKNVAISGFNYRYFVTRETNKPFFINTHVYSAMLIRNDIPYRWRLKYNEDVDLCLQALTNKYCTILLNAFLVDKTSTSAKMKGGNQDELYKNNDDSKKALKASSLKQVWPKYVDVIYRFNRPHHHIAWNKHFTHGLLKSKEDSNGSENS